MNREKVGQFEHSSITAKYCNKLFYLAKNVNFVFI